MKKSLIIALFTALIIICCAGCTQNPELDERLDQDVFIEDRTSSYFYEQTIVVPMNNGYRCVNSNIEFNEDTNQYTVIIQVAQPIK